MKGPRSLVILAVTILSTFAFLSHVCLPSVVNAQKGHGSRHGLSVKEYEDFHDVLHPLQHDALPNKKFKEIRAKSGLLIRLGRAIVRLGVPRGTIKKNQTEFRKELLKFGRSLARYNADARSGTDAQLETSFSAVHDSFEKLAAMLART